MALSITGSAQDQAAEIARWVAIASCHSRGDAYRGKRELPRYNSQLKLEAMLGEAAPTGTDDDAEIFAVTLHNISFVGLAFWARREIDPGMDVLVREFSETEPGQWVAASVTHCTPGIRGFVIGAQFQHPASEEDLEAQFETDEEPEPVPASEIVDRPRRRGLLAWLGLD